MLHVVDDQAEAATVSVTIGLAHSPGLPVVAEGVENAETAALLAALGCDAVRGYHYIRTLPVPQLETWLGGQTQRRRIHQDIAHGVLTATPRQDIGDTSVLFALRCWPLCGPDGA